VTGGGSPVDEVGWKPPPRGGGGEVLRAGAGARLHREQVIELAMARRHDRPSGAEDAHKADAPSPGAPAECRNR